MKHMFIVSEPLLPLVAQDSHHLTLPHLYDSHPRYVDFYRDAANRGATILQDNSIFELKESLTGKFLMESAGAVSATYVMVPEVLRDGIASLEKMNVFFEEIGDAEKRNLFAACVQGKNYDEVAKHYRALATDNRIDLIAIPFNFEFGSRDNPLAGEGVRQAGFYRFSIICRLMADNIWNSNKKHHLLGLFNPIELAYYRRALSKDQYDSIESNDSSSCFWHSLHGVKYSRKHGLLYRKIESHVDFDVGFEFKEQYSLFSRNRGIILDFINGKEKHVYA